MDTAKKIWNGPPLRITYRQIEQRLEAEEWVRKEVLKLVTFYPRILGCQVALSGPNPRHKKGGHFRVHVRLKVPGGELEINREPSLLGRARQAGAAKLQKRALIAGQHSDLRAAVDDAFRAAGRRLQDYARKQRGDVKRHEELAGGPMLRGMARAS